MRHSHNQTQKLFFFCPVADCLRCCLLLFACWSRRLLLLLLSIIVPPLFVAHRVHTFMCMWPCMLVLLIYFVHSVGCFFFRSFCSGHFSEYRSVHNVHLHLCAWFSDELYVQQTHEIGIGYIPRFTRRQYMHGTSVTMYRSKFQCEFAYTHKTWPNATQKWNGLSGADLVAADADGPDRERLGPQRGEWATQPTEYRWHSSRSSIRSASWHTHTHQLPM